MYVSANLQSSEIMAVFDNVDFSQAHEMVVCCILNYLSEGMQFGQKVSYINYCTFKYLS